MKKTLLLLFTLLFVGGANVYATRKYADLSKLAGGNGSNATWNSESKTYSWTGTTGNYSTGLDGTTGDLSAYTSIVVNISDLSDNASGIRLQMKSNNGVESEVVVLTGNGTFTTNLSAFKKNGESMNLTNVEWIRVLGYSNNAGSASAKINYVYLEKPFQFAFDETGKAVIDVSDMTVDGGLSLDPMTGILTTNGEAGYLTVTFPEPVDLSALTRFEVGRSGNDGMIYWTNFKKKNGEYVHNTSAWYSSKFGLSFDAGQAARATDVTQIVLHSNGVSQASGESDEDFATRREAYIASSLTITGMTITSGVVTAADPSALPLTSSMYYEWDGVGANATALQLTGCAYGFGTHTNEIYGDMGVHSNHYADLSSYKTLKLTFTAGTPRLLFNRPTDESSEYIEINNASSEYVNAISATEWEIKLDAIVAAKGYAHLNCIKSFNSSNATIISAILPTEADVDYIISGSGAFAPSVDAALADADATIIDATGVTGTGLTLTSANPNCIFIANAGTLANTQNVCVNDVIAKLVLQDGHPFAYPAGAQATEAQYARTQPNAFGTLCLPFAVSDPDVKYYTTNGVRSSDGALLLKKLDAVPAGTPVIVYNPNYEDSQDYIVLDAGSSALAAAHDCLDDNGVKMVGSFEQQVIDVTEDTSNEYYYIASGAFWHATGTLTVNPFRAYLTTAASVGAKLRLQFGDEETTAIETLTGENNAVEAIYNANGVLQNGLQKGLNIVKMQNGKNVKVYVK